MAVGVAVHLLAEDALVDGHVVVPTLGIFADPSQPRYLLSKEPKLNAWEAAHPPRIDSLEEAS